MDLIERTLVDLVKENKAHFPFTVDKDNLRKGLEPIILSLRELERNKEMNVFEFLDNPNNKKNLLFLFVVGVQANPAMLKEGLKSLIDFTKKSLKLFDIENKLMPEDKIQDKENFEETKEFMTKQFENNPDLQKTLDVFFKNMKDLELKKSPRPKPDKKAKVNEDREEELKIQTYVDEKGHDPKGEGFRTPKAGKDFASGHGGGIAEFSVPTLGKLDLAELLGNQSEAPVITDDAENEFTRTDDMVDKPREIDAQNKRTSLNTPLKTKPTPFQ